MAYEEGRVDTSGTAPGQEPEFQIRVRFPRAGEVLGVIEQLHGYAKMTVKCVDGKARMCRVPGRLTRTLWVRERDIVLVKPWELTPDTKADVIYKYKRNQAEVLYRKGFLKAIESEL
jgi:translation initiation factor 1A